MKYILKRKFLLYCIVIILFNLPLYAQLNQRVITVKQASMDIPGLAKTIAAQTGVEYSLNMQNTSLKKQVHLKPGKWKLEDVMKEVQEQVGLNYKILGDHILFTDYKPVKKVDSVKVAVPAKKTDIVHVTKAGRPAPKKAAPAPVVNKPERQSVSISPLYTLTPQNITPPAIKVNPGHVTNNPQKQTTTNSIARKAPKESKHIEFPDWLSPLAEAGVTANDMVYLSASVKAGIQYMYGIGTLGFTSKGARFRYGAGIRVPLNEFNALHAEFTTGSLSRNYIDSLAHNGKNVQERLNSYGVSWSKTINPRLNLQLELNYSTLKKQGDSTLSKVTAEMDYFGYGKQLYSTKVSAAGTNAQQSSWVGLRVSLFYNLRRK